ncbi:MAG: hypothetical protein ACR2I1_07410, partial [Propionibacteriaceae bacterium]
TVVVIEHNLDVIKTADWIIDMGPDGGNSGGRVVVEGTPEQVAAHPTSYTAEFLSRTLAGTDIPVGEPTLLNELPDLTVKKTATKKAAAKKTVTDQSVDAEGTGTDAARKAAARAYVGKVPGKKAAAKKPAVKKTAAANAPVKPTIRKAS